MIKKMILLLIVLITVFFFTRSASRPEPEPVREWKIADSKAYAQDVVLAWSNNQYECLDKLWTQESNWRSEAYNKIKVMGKNAGGIPQILGLDPKTPAPVQIDRGLSYIYNRYHTPCKAWEFFTKKGYY